MNEMVCLQQRDEVAGLEGGFRITTESQILRSSSYEA